MSTVVCITTGEKENTGNLLTTVQGKSRLIPVHTSILHLYLEDEVTPEEVMMVILRIGHNLLAPTLVLEHMECSRTAMASPQATLDTG